MITSDYGATNAEVQFTIYQFMKFRRTQSLRDAFVTIEKLEAELPFARHRIKVALSRLKADGIIRRVGEDISKAGRPLACYRLTEDVNRKGYNRRRNNGS